MAIQLKIDTAANWVSENPTLASGQLGFESDTGRVKLGDGGAAWNSRPYLGAHSPVFDFTDALAVTRVHGGAILRHPASDDNARTVTLPANSSIPLPVGTVISIENEINTVTLAITSDTLALMDGDTGGTGSVTIAANGSAVARKVTSTRWLVSGIGVASA